MLGIERRDGRSHSENIGDEAAPLVGGRAIVPLVVDALAKLFIGEGEPRGHLIAHADDTLGAKRSGLGLHAAHRQFTRRIDGLSELPNLLVDAAPAPPTGALLE